MAQLNMRSMERLQPCVALMVTCWDFMNLHDSFSGSNVSVLKPYSGFAMNRRISARGKLKSGPSLNFMRSGAHNKFLLSLDFLQILREFFHLNQSVQCIECGVRDLPTSGMLIMCINIS